jgi:hypothetical protein
LLLLNAIVGGRVHPTFKLHAHVEAFAFNDETDVLVGFTDGRLYTWLCPVVCFTDKSLLALTTSSQDAADLGRSAQIVNYIGSRVCIRRVDGSLVYSSAGAGSTVGMF